MKKKNINNIIFSSSCTVYGNPDVLPVSENTPFKKAEFPYGETKQICEKLLEKMNVIVFHYDILILLVHIHHH